MVAAAELAGRGHTCTLTEQSILGGHLSSVTSIHGYPGIEETSGHAFASTLSRTATNAGVEIRAGIAVTSLQWINAGFRAELSDGGSLEAACVVLATGLRPLSTGLAREAAYAGRGVSYCAECDGAFFVDKPVVIYGNGEGAAEAMNLLSQTSKPVYHVIPEATGLAELEVADGGAVFLYRGWHITALEGESALRAVTMVSKADGLARTLDVNGLFVYLGRQPADELVRTFLQKHHELRVTPKALPDLANTGLFVAGELVGTQSLVETCADGVAKARMASSHLQR
jgi:thioredoxin reductase (NADPH)